MKDECEGTGSSLLYPMVPRGTVMCCRWPGLGDLSCLYLLGFMKDWFKETGFPVLYPLTFEGTGLTDLPRLYLLDSPGFSKDGFGRTGSFLLIPVWFRGTGLGFGGTGLVDFSLSCPTRLGLGGTAMGSEATGLGFEGTGLVDSSLSCPTRVGFG